MKVFICYASEQRDLAQRLALALAGIDVEVFFDREDLPPAGEFNLAIRTAIHGSDLFLFLASREALKEGAYTMTELGIAKRRWPHPAQRVLTVLADTTPIAALPPYLSAVTVLEPAGDLVAETVDAVARWRERRRHRYLARAAAVVSALAVVAGFTVWLAKPAPPGAEDAVADIDDGVPNSRVYRLKNGHQVRLVGSVVRNDSNVAVRIIRKYIEWGAWNYNRCYDQHFGQLAGAMPEGNVDISFEISDQLPRNASVVHSDFAQAAFGSCVQATLLGQTLNAAGRMVPARCCTDSDFCPTERKSGRSEFFRCTHQDKSLRPLFAQYLRGYPERAGRLQRPIQLSPSAQDLHRWSRGRLLRFCQICTSNRASSV